MELDRSFSNEVEIVLKCMCYIGIFDAEALVDRSNSFGSEGSIGNRIYF